MLLLEELGNFLFALKHALWHGSHPDGSVDELLGKEVDPLKVVDVDVFDNAGAHESFVQLNLVVLRHEVVLDPQRCELLLASFLWEHKLVEQIGEALVSDKVPLD